MTSDTDALKRAGELLRQSRQLLDEGSEEDPNPEVLQDWMSAWSELWPKLAIGSPLVKQLDAAAKRIRALQS